MSEELAALLVAVVAAALTELRHQLLAWQRRRGRKRTRRDDIPASGG